MSTSVPTPPSPILQASQLRQQFLKDVTKPLQLDNVVIEGDLDLCFRTIKRPIKITHATFTGTVDFRNATFSSTLLLEECIFEQPVKCGDRDLSYCVCESDLSFKGSRFKNTAWFSGLNCKGSGNFSDCKFEWPVSGNPLRDEALPADFTQASFDRELNMSRARFSGAVTFNAMKCGLAAFFDDATFELADPAWPVNFLASSFGLACSLTRAVFHSGALLESLKTGMRLDLRFCRFLKHAKETAVSLDYLSTRHLLLNGAVFDCPVSFSGIRCEGHARLDGIVVYNSPKLESLTGSLSAQVQARFRELLLPLSESSSLENDDGRWWLRGAANGVDYELRSRPDRSIAGNRLLVIPTIFRDSVSFANSSFGSDIKATSAVFEGQISFNSIFCGGAASFENALFEASKLPEKKERDRDCIDFSFSSCGLNVQFRGADCRRQVSFESATIKSGLLLAGGTFTEGLNLTSASVHALSVGDGQVFIAVKSRLDNCRFDIFYTSGDVEQIWKKLVAAQDSHNFTRDPYQMIETYYRGKGMRHLADRVYYAGRDADRRFVGTGASKRFLDALAWFFTGYGVELRRLGYGIALFLIVGTAIFSWDGALVPAKRDTSTQQTPAIRTVSTPCYLKVAHGFGYSLGSLLPVDLHLSKDWEPVGDWRRAYLALHIGAGWIFFPLLLAGITAQLNKN